MPSLDYDAFRKSVKKGEILPAYYIHGDEDLLKDEAVRELLAAAVESSTRDFNCDRRRAADMSADEFVNLALTPPMMAARRALVITEAEDLEQRRQKTQDLKAAIAKYLERPSPETVIVLVQSKGEKPDPSLDRLTASVQVNPLSPERLEKWIRHRAKLEGVELDADAASHLQESVVGDLPQLAAEIAKIAGAVQGRSVTVADVSDLLGVRRDETVHAFVDAVTSRNFGKAATMVRPLLEVPQNSGVRLIIALSTSLTGVALARAQLDGGGGERAVQDSLYQAINGARPFGLRKWGEEARQWVKDARGWTMAALDAALAELLRADRRLKNTSLGGEIEIVTEAVLGMGTK